jgi:hypothetical protein
MSVVGTVEQADYSDLIHYLSSDQQHGGSRAAMLHAPTSNSRMQNAAVLA